MSEYVSECCSAPDAGYMDSGICSKCGEHTDYIDLDPDPTPWCTYCGDKINCTCGPIAENH